MFVKLTFVFVLVAVSNCTIPQVMAGISNNVVNQLLADTIGPLITQQILNHQIAGPINESATIGGVHVQAYLSDIKITELDIKWTQNILEPTSEFNFTFFGRNINLTLSTYLKGKVAVRKIHTTVLVTLTKTDFNISMGIVPCKTNTGAGFSLHVNHIQLDIRQIDVQFLNDTIDTNIVTLIISIVKSSIPNIVNKAATQQINPALDNLMSSRVFLEQPVGLWRYTFDVNTTELPRFVNKSYLSLPIDVSIYNLDQHRQNPEIQNQQLPYKVFKNVHEAELIVSSGFTNCLVWLVEDSEVLSVVADDSMLNDDSPIRLNTTVLTILLPALPTLYGPNKGVYVRVGTSTKTPELYIRSGRFIVSISVNLEFIVDMSRDYPSHKDDLDACIINLQCARATTLNTSVLVSAAVMSDERNTVFGNVQLVKIQDIQVSKESPMPVNVNNLRMILNTLVGTFVAPANLMLRQGVPIPMSILKGFNITNIQLKTELDYAAVGLTLQIK